MIARKLMTISAAAALAISPTVAYSASPLAAARAGAALGDASEFAGSRSTQITLGFLVLLAILLVTLSGDDEGPQNPPVSP